jgi:aerobic C4-dicarboxylate transport protein
MAEIAMLPGADRFMAQKRAATDLTSNIIETLVVRRSVGGVDLLAARKELQAELAGVPSEGA